MDRQINWSKNAQEDLESVLKFLQKDWPEKTAHLFLQKLSNKLTMLMQFPDIGRKYSDNNSVRSLVLTKQISIFYLYKEEILTILGLFDTRQNPDNKKF